MSTPGKRSPPRNINMVSQSHDSDEDMSTPPGSTKENRSLSRNAQAQARLRARRKAYVESLESNVKRLQTIVDAIALNPNRAHAITATSPSSPFSSSPEIPSSDPSIGQQQPSESVVHQLQVDNARLRRERDALQVQIDALIGYISRGYTNPTDSTLGGTGQSIDQGLSPNPGSDAEIDSRVPAAEPPLIQGDAYSQDELTRLLSLDDNLAFMRYLNLHASGSPSLQVPHSTSSSNSLSVPGTQTEPMSHYIQGAHDISNPNIMFRGVEP
ncbi:hypothetical protein RSOLAG22IIIB_11533 [Rhizoctonia solani]|uniref:BZIP domain-containing protein n=1 Tax=Rhizoctonia solani TaxID=456999 RepID=A0A0K6G914_9AGAM|nr:hypothetical protein RSOLAG22IIIB_11533 [Rhizoctonia solani]